MNKRIGRKPISIIDSVPFSQIVFLVSSGVNYAQSIAEKRGTEPSPTFQQLERLRKEGYLKSKKEMLLYKTIYEVNWDKINEDFVNYIEKVIIKRREQLKAYFGREYEKYIENQENKLKRIDTPLDLGIPKKLQERENNEEKAVNRFVQLVSTRRLNKNKYLKKLFEVLFKDCSEVYIQRNIPITIKEIFEEAKQTFGFESFTNKIWGRMLDIVYYQEIFPHTKFYDWNSEERNRAEKRLKIMQERYSQMRNENDIGDILVLEDSLRFAFWGFLVPNASYKMTLELIKNNNLITEGEYQSFEKNSHLDSKNIPKYVSDKMRRTNTQVTHKEKKDTP